MRGRRRRQTDTESSIELFIPVHRDGRAFQLDPPQQRLHPNLIHGNMLVVPQHACQVKGQGRCEREDQKELDS